jgi:hypothetical protein
MKSPKLLTIVLVLALLGVYYVFGTAYLKQKANNVALASQIAAADQQLAQIPPASADQPQRLAAANAGLQAELILFPAQLNSTRLVNDILKLAETTGVKAVPLVTQPWTLVSENQTDYPVFRLNIDVKGTYGQVADFINRLENGEPPTLVIETLTMDIAVETRPDETGETDTIMVDAILNVAVYIRPTLKVSEP